MTFSLYFGKVFFMTNTDKKIWDSRQAQQLVQVLSEMKDSSTIQNFLRDVLTEKEIIEISARLEAARLLNSKQKYTAISEQTKLSSRTIARISEWLQNGTNGYKSAFSIIEKHHQHIPPARD